MYLVSPLANSTVPALYTHILMIKIMCAQNVDHPSGYTVCPEKSVLLVMSYFYSACLL